MNCPLWGCPPRTFASSIPLSLPLSLSLSLALPTPVPQAVYWKRKLQLSTSASLRQPTLSCSPSIFFCLSLSLTLSLSLSLSLALSLYTHKQWRVTIATQNILMHHLHPQKMAGNNCHPEHAHAPRTPTTNGNHILWHPNACKGKEGRRQYLKWDGFDFVFLWLLALLDAVGVVRAFGQECVSQRERKPRATGRRISSGVVLSMTQCCLQQFIGIQTKMCT